MQNYDIYNDIAERTSGEIYIGVVGPVRTGKSTFVSKFMETLVIPNISGKNKKTIATDELPQSAVGKTIMTTEPKFVPANAVAVQFGKISAKIRLIDCVGYLAEGAVGHEENGAPRMVKTPWADENLPFEKAAEIGTAKVISEHSTIGVLVTSDGTVGDLPRASFIKPEERVVGELKGINKPFVIVLNTISPEDKETQKLAKSMRAKYSVPVLPLNVLEMQEDDINKVIETVLYEFPIKSIDIDLPAWMKSLPSNNGIIGDIIQEVAYNAEKMAKMCDYTAMEGMFAESQTVEIPHEVNVRLADGTLSYKVNAKPELFYKVLSDECGENVENELGLMNYVRGLRDAKFTYSKLKQALADAQETGYGVVAPSVEEMSLDEPEVVRQGGRYGVKLKAQAPSLHIIKVDVEAEVNPSVASEQQGEELVKYLLSEFDSNPSGIWNTNMFGKPLSLLVREGIAAKLDAMPKNVQGKMRKTVTRIVNEGKGGVICILL